MKIIAYICLRQMKIQFFMTSDFSQEEKDILKGHLSAIARKYGCSHTTVQDILNGKYKLNTPLRKKIYIGMKKTVEFFTPLEQ